MSREGGESSRVDQGKIRQNEHVPESLVGMARIETFLRDIKGQVAAIEASRQAEYIAAHPEEHAARIPAEVASAVDLLQALRQYFDDFKKMKPPVFMGDEDLAQAENQLQKVEKVLKTLTPLEDCWVPFITFLFQGSVH